MPKARYLVVASGLFTAGLSLWATGCGHLYEDCLKGELCISTRISAKPVCEGSPLDVDPVTGNLKAFNEACSIFAFSNAPGSSPDGTKAKPYNSLQGAIDQASGKWIIACNNATFDENVTTRGSVQVYGGFSCANLEWKRNETNKTALAASMPMPNKDFNVVALTLQNGPASGNGSMQDVKVIFQDFAIIASNAIASGGSSIGAVVDEEASAEFVSCDVKVRDGLDGASAVAPAAALNGSQPTQSGRDACLLPIRGGIGSTTSCSDGNSRGGNGGRGGDNKAASMADLNGQPGENGDSSDATHGRGGQGDVAGSGCTPGLPGEDGALGKEGLGGADFGSLSLTGITGGDGEPGIPGARGHGGGGGGGRVHGVFCNGNDGPGASGGAGGAGGCGGEAGGGGMAGGSSIGIISLGPNLKLTDVTLETAKGGNGGAGANGASGGTGADGGVGGLKGPDSGSFSGCDGGKGGNGGGGGPGGGGRGGHSIGVVYKTTPTTPPLLKPLTQGAPGTGGGSSSTSATGKGAAGISAVCWDLSTNTPCSP